MYINVPPSYWILATHFFTFIHSATSQPIQPSNWIKGDQYKDSNSRGEWRGLEKDDDPMAGPSLHDLDHIPMGSLTKLNNELREQEASRLPHTNGDSSSRSPIVSILVSELPKKSTNKIHKPYMEHLQLGRKSELEEITKNAIATDQKHRYEEALRYIDMKNTLNQKQSETEPTSSPSSGLTISLFSYRFSIPISTTRLQTAGLLGHPLSRNFATVIVLLVLVWITMFIVGLFELGNYLWSRTVQTCVDDIDADEEQDVELGELVKMPFSVVAVPVKKDVQIFPVLMDLSMDTASSDLESNSESDENDHDYWIF